jgi:hypothetical protein
MPALAERLALLVAANQDRGDPEALEVVGRERLLLVGGR